MVKLQTSLGKREERINYGSERALLAFSTCPGVKRFFSPTIWSCFPAVWFCHPSFSPSHCNHLVTEEILWTSSNQCPSTGQLFIMSRANKEKKAEAQHGACSLLCIWARTMRSIQVIYNRGNMEIHVYHWIQEAPQIDPLASQIVEHKNSAVPLIVQKVHHLKRSEVIWNRQSRRQQLPVPRDTAFPICAPSRTDPVLPAAENELLPLKPLWRRTW